MENKRIGIKEFENTIIPDGWARCFNEACRLHDSCVRFKAGEALSDNQTEGCSVYPKAVKKTAYASITRHTRPYVPHGDSER